LKRSLQLNPDNRPATWQQVREWRDIHEASPVDSQFGVFDCGPMADKRLYEQLDLFDYLTTLNEDGTLSWKRADNTWVNLTKADLATLYHEIRVNRAKRAGLLHIKAAAYEAMETKPTVVDLKSLSYWLN